MEYKETSTLKGAIKQLTSWAESNPTQEVCGFLGFNDESKKFIVTIEDNIASDPQSFFAISPVRFLKFKSSYKMGAVWHSHIYGSEEPSTFDETMAYGCQMPFFIYSCQTKTTGIYKPANSKHQIEL